MSTPSPTIPWLRLIAMTGLTVLLVIGVGWFGVTRGQALFNLVGGWLDTHVGLPGMLLMTVLVDTFPSPFSFVPLLVLKVHEGAPLLSLWWMFTGASMIGGFSGFHLGRAIGLPVRWTTRLESRFPGSLEWLRQHAGWGIVLFAILPLPYSLATWSAGSLGTPLRTVMLATTARGVKVAIIIFGLSLGQDIGGNVVL